MVQTRDGDAQPGPACGRKGVRALDGCDGIGQRGLDQRRGGLFGGWDEVESHGDISRCFLMDCRVDWEDVNRITGINILMYVPNLSVSAYILMYLDGRR